MRFTDFLRTSVLLFGGAATALAAVGIAGAVAKDDTVLVYIALGWWVIAAVAGLWMGRRPEATGGIAGLLAGASNATSMPEPEPGAVVFNRLWAFGLLTLVAGAVAFLVPQVPAVAAGYALLVALAWRNQAGAVKAIEERDGVQFHVERTSPFRPTRLIRTPGLRRFEPGAR